MLKKSKMVLVILGILMMSSSLFAQQVKKVFPAVSVDDEDRGAWLIGNELHNYCQDATKVEGGAIWEGVVDDVIAPAYCIAENDQGENRVYMFDGELHHCVGYNDAMDISAYGMDAWMIAESGEIFGDINLAEQSPLFTAQPLLPTLGGSPVKPTAIDVGPDGLPWIVAEATVSLEDEYPVHIYKLNEDHQWEDKVFYRYGNAPCSLVTPTDIAVDSDGNIYFALPENKACGGPYPITLRAGVTVFSPEGEILDGFHEQAAIRVDIDSEDNLWTIDKDGKLFKNEVAKFPKYKTSDVGAQ